MSTRTVLVCQNTTCLSQGSAKVLAVVRSCSIPNVIINGCGCLGQCGNGPMMLVLPEQVWYCHVRPHEVGIIIEQHLKGKQPVKALLYQKFHPSNSLQSPEVLPSKNAWWMVWSFMVFGIGVIFWTISFLMRSG